MTRSNEKARCGELIDHISELPSDVVDGILQHLNVRDLVRTSILSRKWRYMWASVPRLKFSGNFFHKYEHLESVEISRIITEVLLVHNGPVNMFILRTPISSTNNINIEYLNKWILFLSRRGIKYLELDNGGTVPDHMPSHIFSCQELTYFYISEFKLSVVPNFCGFKCLLELHLRHISFESGAFESVISGCPILEELYIFYCSGFECIDFSAPFLKVFCIESGQVIKPICLEKAKSLVDLTLISSHDNNDRGWISNLINCLSEIQRLTLGPAYNKVMSADTIPLALQKTFFSSLNYLNLGVEELNERELLYIVSVLKSTSNLVQLVIEGFSNDRTNQVSDTFEELECSGCCLSQLQTVNIEVETSVLYAMRLTQFILATSPSLETLTFELCVDPGYAQLDAGVLLSIKEDLLRMKKASPRAQVEFLH